MCVLPLFVAASLSYSLLAQPPWDLWIVDWLALTAAVFLMHRMLGLILPHHRRGQTLALSFVVLIPRFAWLPAQVSPNAVAIFFSSAAALLATRIHLRDGLKPISLLLFGMVLGLGLDSSPAFLQVIPWTLLTVLASRRWGKKLLLGCTWMLSSFLLSFILPRWLVSQPFHRWIGARSVPTESSAFPGIIMGENAIDILRSIGSPSSLVSSSVDLIYVLLSCVIVVGFLQGTKLRRHVPIHPADPDKISGSEAWRQPWRLSKPFARMVLVGMVSALGWGVWEVMIHNEPPRLDDFFLAKPWIAILAAVGFANVTDWIRRRRFIGNLWSEHLILYGLILHITANLICLLTLLQGR